MRGVVFEGTLEELLEFFGISREDLDGEGESFYSSFSGVTYGIEDLGGGRYRVLV